MDFGMNPFQHRSSPSTLSRSSKFRFSRTKIGFLEHVQSGETNDKTRKPSEKLDRRRLDAAVAAVQISVEQ
jgi:hypothetical protein